MVADGEAKELRTHPWVYESSSPSNIWYSILWGTVIAIPGTDARPLPRRGCHAFWVFGARELPVIDRCGVSPSLLLGLPLDLRGLREGAREGVGRSRTESARRGFAHLCRMHQGEPNVMFCSLALHLQYRPSSSSQAKRNKGSSLPSQMQGTHTLDRRIMRGRTSKSTSTGSNPSASTSSASLTSQPACVERGGVAPSPPA